MKEWFTSADSICLVPMWNRAFAGRRAALARPLWFSTSSVSRVITVSLRCLVLQAVDQVAHLVFLGPQVGFRGFDGVDQARDALHDFQAGALDGFDLFGIVGE